MLESVLVRIFWNSHANMERNFALPGLTTRHAHKDMKPTFNQLLKHIENTAPNVYRPGRKSNYVIPNAIMKGAALIEKEGGQRGDEEVPGEGEGGSTGQGGSLETQNADSVALEISAEDISVEASI